MTAVLKLTFDSNVAADLKKMQIELTKSAKSAGDFEDSSKRLNQELGSSVIDEHAEDLDRMRMSLEEAATAQGLSADEARRLAESMRDATKEARQLADAKGDVTQAERQAIASGQELIVVQKESGSTILDLGVAYLAFKRSQGLIDSVISVSPKLWREHGDEIKRAGRAMGGVATKGANKLAGGMKGLTKVAVPVGVALGTVVVAVIALKVAMAVASKAAEIVSNTIKFLADEGVREFVELRQSVEQLAEELDSVREIQFQQSKNFEQRSRNPTSRSQRRR